jgi:hypothetical protein
MLGFDNSVRESMQGLHKILAALVTILAATCILYPLEFITAFVSGAILLKQSKKGLPR